MVGAAIVRQLESKGNCDIITRTHSELDLLDQAAVAEFFNQVQVDQVYLAAAKVGGIYAINIYPAEFIYENLMIECNVVHSAFKAGVQNLLFLGSSCIYPKSSNQPIVEGDLLTGILEPTNEPYAIAKIAGIKLCESYNRQYGTQYRAVMPTNLFGEGDNFHPENSHVIPAMMQRFHKAKLNNDASVNVWGTGKAMREFLYVDDMAAACVHVMGLNDSVYQEHTKPMQAHINVGTGKDVTIKELAEIIRRVVGFQGELQFAPTKPDGVPRKLLDVSRLRNLGWQHVVELEEGIMKTYDWYLKALEKGRVRS